MTHEVQLVIGREEVVKRFVQAWNARAVELSGGWLAIPVDEALAQKVSTGRKAPRPGEEVGVAPPGLAEAMEAATRNGGGLAYAETMYWGGQGEQWAFAYVDGRMAVHPRRSTGAGGPINHALREIGVRRSEQDDEFDTIGLGERRTMDDYAPEGPRRLREQAHVDVQPIAKAPTLPIWVVLMLIATFIVLGVAVSLVR